MTLKDKRTLALVWLLALAGFGICAWQVFHEWAYYLWAAAKIKDGTMIAQIFLPIPGTVIFSVVGLVLIGMAITMTRSTRQRNRPQ